MMDTAVFSLQDLTTGIRILHSMAGLNIPAGNEDLENKIISTTKTEIKKRALISICVLILHVLLSGLFFSYLEVWSIPDGFYFAFSTFMTIGYGDLALKNYIGRSVFIWYVFMVAVSTTNFYTMMTELAVDNWQITRKTISRRIDRYEHKAKWLDLKLQLDNAIKKEGDSTLRRRNSIH